jgi:hypothetical protein
MFVYFIFSLLLSFLLVLFFSLQLLQFLLDTLHRHHHLIKLTHHGPLPAPFLAFQLAITSTSSSLAFFQL